MEQKQNFFLCSITYTQHKTVNGTDTKLQVSLVLHTRNKKLYMEDGTETKL